MSSLYGFTMRKRWSQHWTKLLGNGGAGAEWLVLQHHTPSIQEFQATMTYLAVPRLILFKRLRIGEDQAVGQPSSKATRRTLKISAGDCF